MGLDMKYIIRNRRENIYLEQILEELCHPNLYSEIDGSINKCKKYLKKLFEIFKAPSP